MALTPEAELELIDAAISRILAGTVASLTQGPLAFETLDLNKLYARKAILEQRIARKSVPFVMRVEGVRYDA